MLQIHSRFVQNTNKSAGSIYTQWDYLVFHFNLAQEFLVAKKRYQSINSSLILPILLYAHSHTHTHTISSNHRTFLQVFSSSMRSVANFSQALVSVAGDSLCFLLDTDRDRNVSTHFIINGLQKSQQLPFRRSHVAMQICLVSSLHRTDIDSFSCFTYVFDTADLVICWEVISDSLQYQMSWLFLWQSSVGSSHYIRARVELWKRHDVHY